MNLKRKNNKNYIGRLCMAICGFRQLLMLLSVGIVAIIYAEVCAQSKTASVFVEFYLASAEGTTAILGVASDQSFFDGLGSVSTTLAGKLTTIGIMGNSDFHAFDKISKLTKLTVASCIKSNGQTAIIEFFMSTGSGNVVIVGFTDELDFFNGIGTAASNSVGSMMGLTIINRDYFKNLKKLGMTAVSLSSATFVKAVR